MKKPWILSYPVSAQQKLWSDLAGAQFDQSLRWVHSHFVGFAMSWIIYWLKRLHVACWVKNSADDNYEDFVFHFSQKIGFNMQIVSLGDTCNLHEISKSFLGKIRKITSIVGFTGKYKCFIESTWRCSVTPWYSRLVLPVWTLFIVVSMLEVRLSLGLFPPNAATITSR